VSEKGTIAIVGSANAFEAEEVAKLGLDVKKIL
jgi:hypothetical protein